MKRKERVGWIRHMEKMRKKDEGIAKIKRRYEDQERKRKRKMKEW